MYIASERLAARRCHRIVCVADAMREQALAANIGRRAQYVTVYSGMEVETFLHPERTRVEARAALGLAERDFARRRLERTVDARRDPVLHGGRRTALRRATGKEAALR